MLKKSKKIVKDNVLLPSFDRLHHEVVQSRDQLLDLSDIVIGGRPLIANFENLTFDDANYMLIFLSGVVYGLRGEVHKMGEKTFLFARAEEFSDGSLHQYIKDLS